MARVPLCDNVTGQGLLLTTLALLAVGAVMVPSALQTLAPRGEWYDRVGVRDTFYTAAAAVVLLTAWRLNVRRLNAGKRFPWLAALLLGLALVCGGLVFVPGIGHEVGQKYRWIRPRGSPIGFQPSELIKLTLVVFLAAWLTRKGDGVRRFFRAFLPGLALTGACAGLVVTQDFGTAMLIVASAGVTMLLAGVRWYYLVALVGVAAAGFYFFVYLDPDRWGRVLAMLDPWSRTNRASYQAGQSILTVVSGGLTGQGLGLGTQKLGYLPEDSTDFIFAVICEELGFRGAVLVMGLILVWVWLARRAAAKAQDRFGSVLAGSLGFLIGLQAVLHIAVNLVVVPPKGLGLPFVSAGGTSLVIMAGAAAAIVSVTSRQPADASREVRDLPRLATAA